jgi:hypothetical protein
MLASATTASSQLTCNPVCFALQRSAAILPAPKHRSDLDSMPILHRFQLHHLVTQAPQGLPRCLGGDRPLG